MTLDWLHFVLIALALACAAWALLSRKAASPDTARIEADRDQLRQAADSLKSERDALRQRADAAEKKLAAEEARAGEREASARREREAMVKQQAEGEQRFQVLADAALRKSQEHFVKVADETLKKHKEGAAGELKALMQPIQENFTQFRDKVAEIEKVRSEDRAKLDEQLKAVGETARLTAETTTRLSTALTTTRGAGRWGEETLRNVLEVAGLSPHADFVEQTSTATEKGMIRPDVIIKMPGGRHLVIDSKVSLEDYMAAADESDPGRRKQRLAAHAARVKAHVTSLSRKDYWKDIPDTVDFVVMFLPGENFYAAVLEHDREIFDYAWRNSVMIATPSTLIALAKSVAFGWRQEDMAKNAEEAAKLGRDLYDRLTTMMSHMTSVGGGLGNAMNAYNKMVGSFEARVLPAAKRFEQLSFTDNAASLEAPPQLDTAPRQLTLLDPADAPVAEKPKKAKA
jgi:DNA recombination protein RmuC